MIVLLIIYLSRNLFGADVMANVVPDTPPVKDFPQVSYWNDDFEYGFRGEKGDFYNNRAFSGVDRVAVDSQE